MLTVEGGGGVISWTWTMLKLYCTTHANTHRDVRGHRRNTVPGYGEGDRPATVLPNCTPGGRGQNTLMILINITIRKKAEPSW